jgi:hypothetical protein
MDLDIADQHFPGAIQSSIFVMPDNTSGEWCATCFPITLHLSSQGVRSVSLVTYDRRLLTESFPLPPLSTGLE